MNAYLTLALSIVIAIAGQLSLKAGAAAGEVAAAVYLNPFVLVGLFLYLSAALLYVQALRTIPLSVAFPSVSISYVAVAFLAHTIWGEPFGTNQIVALALITSGILLLIRT